MLRDTAGERRVISIISTKGLLRPLLVAILLISLYFAAQKHPAMLRDTAREEVESC